VGAGLNEFAGGRSIRGLRGLPLITIKKFNFIDDDLAGGRQLFFYTFLPPLLNRNLFLSFKEWKSEAIPLAEVL